MPIRSDDHPAEPAREREPSSTARAIGARRLRALRHFLTRAILVVFALLVAASSVCAAAPARTDDAARLRAQAERWDQAIVARNRADIEANMADDFRQIDGAGNVEDKHSFVEGLLDPELRIDPYTVEDFDIRFYGDVALLCGRTRMTGQYASKPFTSHYRYIDIYVRRGGQWRIVSVQISKLPQ